MGSKLIGPRALLAVIALLVVLRLLISLLSAPPAIAGPLTLVVSAIFLAIPVIGMFWAASGLWDKWNSLKFLIGGIVVQVGMMGLLQLFPRAGLITSLIQAVGQGGLLAWCAGLGALLALMLKEKNLLLPVALFLAGFDVFLVTNPAAPTRAILESKPQVFQNVAMTLPKVQQTGESVPIPVAAYVGPADFIFLFMFFVSLYRWKMNARGTYHATLVALIAYLLVVLLFGDRSIGPISLGALPVLLPLGAVFLAVNWNQFKMNTEEKIATMLAGVLAVGLAFMGIRAAANAKALPAEPSKSVPAQESPESPS